MPSALSRIVKLLACAGIVHCWLSTIGANRCALAQEEPPTEWIEPATGHRVVRLSREAGSQSLYFHQNPYSADGKKLIFTTPNGISVVNLETREITNVVDGRVSVLVTGRKTGNVYYTRGGAIYAADIDTAQSRKVVDLPAQYRGGNITVNADETLVVGVGSDPDGEAKPRTPPANHPVDARITSNWAAGRPMLLYTVSVGSGEVKVLYHCNDWLNHLQCSPTDPGQIMLCHEGPWHFVDRIWLIRTDGSGLTSVHPRTMDMEIAGHEFFSQDGKSILYDLQTPRSMVFWLARYDIATGARTWYHVERNNWSVHFNVSPDGTLFAGDGGGPASVANMDGSGNRLDPPGNGQWIVLFRPELTGLVGLPEQAARQVKTGSFRAERLVDLSKHNYSLEPNVTFTPDGRWIVFRSNMHGPTHVYAVEVAK